MLDRLKRWWFYAITVDKDPTDPDTFIVYIVRRWSGERVTYVRAPINWLLDVVTPLLPLSQAWCWTSGIPPICAAYVETKLRLLKETL